MPAKRDIGYCKSPNLISFVQETRFLSDTKYARQMGHRCMGITIAETPSGGLASMKGVVRVVRARGYCSALLKKMENAIVLFSIMCVKLQHFYRATSLYCSV
jgi:hypothetical protein